MLKHLFVEFRITKALIMVLEVSILSSLYNLLLLLAFKYTSLPQMHWLENMETAIAAIIGTLLVFRTNRAYERWWEARSLWGTLVNVSRNLAIKIKVIVEPSPEDAKAYARLIGDFGQALAIHLRQTPDNIALKALANSETLPIHTPAYIAKTLFSKIYRSLEKSNKTFEQLLLDPEFRELMVVCGGCEKIKNTLMSTSYRMFIKHVIVLCIIVMPFPLIQSMGYYSILVTLFSSYLILALEAIARNLEEPFGICEDHIQVCQINSNIKASVNEILCS